MEVVAGRNKIAGAVVEGDRGGAERRAVRRVKSAATCRAETGHVVRARGGWNERDASWRTWHDWYTWVSGALI